MAFCLAMSSPVILVAKGYNKDAAEGGVDVSLGL